MFSIVRAKTIFRNNDFTKSIHKRFRSLFFSTMTNVSPVLLAKLRYREIKGTWPNLKNPQNFDEKLLWLMLYWCHPLKTQCGDKYMMRTYVKACGLEHILPELHGVYEHSNEIIFNELPKRYVLKCTHGCGFNIVCSDNESLDVGETKRQLDEWLKVDFSKVYGEVHYASMKPRIICEKFLDDLSSELPSDYKVYCFGGRAHCTMACTERILNGRAKYDIYDREWNNKLPYSKSSLLENRIVAKPEAYEEMIEAAEKLSEPFPFVRIDFYSINGKAVLGEMTFTPAGCVDQGYTDLAQCEMGKLIELPKKLLQ